MFEKNRNAGVSNPMEQLRDRTGNKNETLLLLNRPQDVYKYLLTHEEILNYLVDFLSEKYGINKVKLKSFLEELAMCKTDEEFESKHKKFLKFLLDHGCSAQEYFSALDATFDKFSSQIPPEQWRLLQEILERLKRLFEDTNDSDGVNQVEEKKFNSDEEQQKGSNKREGKTLQNPKSLKGLVPKKI